MDEPYPINTTDTSFSESWDRKFGVPADHEGVSSSDFMSRLYEMQTFIPSND